MPRQLVKTSGTTADGLPYDSYDWLFDLKGDDYNCDSVTTGKIITFAKPYNDVEVLLLADTN